MDGTILTKIGSFLLLLLAGAAGKKLGFFNKDMENSFSRFMVNICVPCLMINSMTGADLPPEKAFFLRLLSITAVTLLLALIFGYAGSFLISRDRAERRFYVILMTVCNTGNIGQPVSQMLFGELGTVYSALFSLMSTLVLWTIGVWLMAGSRKFDWRQFCTPIMAAIVLGFSLFLLRVQLPTVLSHAMEDLGNMTGPLAMLIVGCNLADQGIKALANSKLVRFLVVKQVLLLAALLPVLRLLFGEIEDVGIAVVLASMPTAVNVVAFAYDQHQDGQAAASAVLGSTLVSLALLPALLWTVQH